MVHTLFGHFPDLPRLPKETHFLARDYTEACLAASLQWLLGAMELFIRFSFCVRWPSSQPVTQISHRKSTGFCSGLCILRSLPLHGPLCRTPFQELSGHICAITNGSFSSTLPKAAHHQKRPDQPAQQKQAAKDRRRFRECAVAFLPQTGNEW